MSESGLNPPAAPPPPNLIEQLRSGVPAALAMLAGMKHSTRWRATRDG
jgi:hypothetical protein